MFSCIPARLRPVFGFLNQLFIALGVFSDELCHCIKLASVKYLFMDGPRAQVGVDAGRQVALKVNK